MIKYLLSFSLVFSSLFALDLNSVLQNVQKNSQLQLSLEKQRLQEFIDNKNDQEKLLKSAKSALHVEEKNTDELKKLIDENEEKLAKKQEELNEKSASLGEMFGSVRQTSSDFLENYQNSLTPSQDNTKYELLLKLSKSKKLATVSELNTFWHYMLDEIIKNSNIATYEADVILNDGSKTRQQVTRVGSFSAVSNGHYLTYSNNSKALVQLPNDPDFGSQKRAKIFENSSDMQNLIIDPTRGSLFELLKNKPTIMDRIHQGGVVGYVILFLGAIGILFSIYRIIILNIIDFKINKQIKNLSTPNLNNSLGKIADIFYKNKDDSVENLEIKISESILNETQKVQKGHSFVKLLAAVTPLLGLLGTVTGMIATFQAITLFGTGDPKLMAGGISTALITTVQGLITAIPLLFAYTYISSKAEDIASTLEEQSIGLLARTLK